MSVVKFYVERDPATFMYKMAMKVDIMLVENNTINYSMNAVDNEIEPINVNHKKAMVGCQFKEEVFVEPYWQTYLVKLIEEMFRNLNKEEPVVDLLTIFRHAKSEIFTALTPNGKGLINKEEYKTAHEILDAVEKVLTEDPEGVESKVIIPETAPVSLDYVPGMTKDDAYIPEVAKRVPALQKYVKYPKGTKYAGRVATLSNVIQWLNDREKWTREQIADWLESLDVDLTVETE